MSGARRRFRFLKEIAEGGFGKVYLAEQLSADGFSRIVAVKLLHAKWSSHDEVVMRTRDEARLLGLIRHQNIVKVEDLTSIDGKCALVMEYLEGVDLKWMLSFLQDKSMAFPRAALFEIMLSTCSALDAAYNGVPLQGGEPLRVIHRDIKPSNIFVTVNGGVKVLDFGTARANFAEREAKTQALAFGSQGYMAPERMLGEEDTPAADVFSLGVTLYELLALETYGRIPPRPNKFVAKMNEKVDAIPLEGDPEWCEQVRETLRLMLSYEPSERPTASQLVDVFELLAQNAGDMGLRRFCRTLVTEAKANEPDLDTGDPLAGSTVEEDESSQFAIGAGGVPQVGPPPDVDQSTSSAFGQAPPPPDTGSLGLQPPPPSAGPSGQPSSASPAPTAPSASAPSSAVAPDAPTLPSGQAAAPGTASIPPVDSPKARSGGGILKLVLLGAGIAGGTLLLGSVVLAAGAFYLLSEQGADTVTVSSEPEVVEAPAEPETTGSKIVSQDERTDVPRARTVLTYAGDAGADITIIGGVGFKAEWDGKGEFDLGELAEGAYRTNVTPVGGSKLRNKTFDVVAGAGECRFTFEDEAWKGGCDAS